MAAGLTLIAFAVGLPLGALFVACLATAALLVATNLILRRQTERR